MTKGVSQLIIVVLILMIGIALTSAAYVWSKTTMFNIFPEKTQDTSYLRQKACLGIFEMTADNIIINNCGSVPLKDLKLFVNGVSQDIGVTLNPSSKTVIIINLLDNSTVYVTSDYATSLVMTYEKGCLLDSECDDGNACTTGTCYFGDCKYTILIDGTKCQDDEVVADHCDTTSSNVCSGSAKKRVINKKTIYSCQSGICVSSYSYPSGSCGGSQGCYVSTIPPVGCEPCH